VPLLPSGGIAVADVPTWLDAGALSVAIGSELDAAHAAGGVDAVTALAATAAATTAHHPATHQPHPLGVLS
jgi:2-dehydro-3-deoxyphosphogluconate aldolase/(4S)-4-hydroxy-2-oxoglutarate aldolase